MMIRCSCVTDTIERAVSDHLKCQVLMVPYGERSLTRGQTTGSGGGGAQNFDFFFWLLSGFVPFN